MEPEVGHTKDANELASERTELAFERSLMALERTTMAWMRTSLALIGFGFTIHQVLWALRESALPNLRQGGPRYLGLTLIVMGTLAMAFATIQHALTMRRIGRVYGQEAGVSLALFASIILCVVGMAAFVSIAFRAGPF